MILKDIAIALLSIVFVLVPKNLFQETCPIDMLKVGPLCIDKYEAPNIRGKLPFGMVSFPEAKKWCEKRQKRLCTVQEWEKVCLSNPPQKYYYGKSFKKGQCNTGKPPYKVAPKVKWRWSDISSLEGKNSFSSQLDPVWEENNSIGQNIWNNFHGVPSGSYPACINDTSVQDMLGNVSEWVSIPNSKKGILKGGGWDSEYSCMSRKRTKGPLDRYLTSGFRCCSDPDKSPFQEMF